MGKSNDSERKIEQVKKPRSLESTTSRIAAAVLIWMLLQMPFQVGDRLPELLQPPIQYAVWLLLFLVPFTLLLGKPPHNVEVHRLHHSSGEIICWVLIEWGIAELLSCTFEFVGLNQMFHQSFFLVMDDSIWAGIWFFMFSVLMEEFVFRGYICRYLAPYNRTLAVLLSAYLFAGVHGNPVQIIDAFLFGIVTGYVYLETGNLIYPYLMHFLSNLCSNFAFTWYQRYFQGGEDTFLVLKVAIALCVLLIALLVLTKITRKNGCLGPVSFCKRVVQSIAVSKKEYREGFFSPGMIWVHLLFLILLTNALVSVVLVVR